METLNFEPRINPGQGYANPRAAVLHKRGSLYRRRHIAWQPRSQRRHYGVRIFDSRTPIYVRHVGHAHRSVFLFRRLARDRAPLIFDGDVRHRIDELPKKVYLRSLHQARHHDGEANAHRHPKHADESCRTRVLTWVHAMLSKRFVVMRVTGLRCICRRSCVHR